MRADDDRYVVDAVDKALSVLALVARTPDIGLSELARQSGESKARAYRLLKTLERRNFVACAPVERTYRLSHAALVLGHAASQQVDLVHIARLHLEKLGLSASETTQIRVVDGLESLCVARWEPPREVFVRATIGRRLPLHAGSNKVLLAFADDTVQERVLAGPLEKLTSQTCSDPEAVRHVLARIRADGYFVSRAEISLDLVSICAPILDRCRKLAGSINLVAPAIRVDDAALRRFVDAVLATAESISWGLGMPPTDAAKSGSRR